MSDIRTSNERDPYDVVANVIAAYQGDDDELARRIVDSLTAEDLLSAGHEPQPNASNDLLTRLRTGYLCETEGCRCHAIEARSGCQCAEAADEIERLQRELDRRSPLSGDEQAEAWESVWAKLSAFNPAFARGGRSGEECALLEIDRLQRAAHEPRVEHRCQTHLWQGHAACPICNPDKTVPELNRAAQPPATEPPAAPVPPPGHWVRYADSEPYERPYYLATYSGPQTKHAKAYVMLAQEDFDRLLRQRAAKQPASELRDALDAIASPSRHEDYGWWTQVARRALGYATKNETAIPPALDYGVTPTLAAVRMAIHTFDVDRNERRVLEEIQETVRHALPPGLWRSALLDKPMESDGPVVLVFTGEAYSVEYPSDVNGVEHVAWCRITPYTRLTKAPEHG